MTHINPSRQTAQDTYLASESPRESLDSAKDSVTPAVRADEAILDGEISQ